MVRAVKAGELFATFIFDGKDCADMGVYNVTSGSVYTLNIEPVFNDNKLEVPAYDGKYYYGTQITGQQFQFNCFCHDLLTQEYDALRSWLYPRRIGRLILSDQPYKYYLVKVANITALSAYPLTTIQTPQHSALGDYVKGDVVYTGNFTVTFETVGSAYGYGLSYYRDDLIYDAKEKYGRDYYYDSGLLYKDMNPDTHWKIPANASEFKIPMYNPGSAEGRPVYTIEHTGTFANNTYMQITNKTMGTSTVIELSGIKGNAKLDMASQTIEDEEGNAYYGRFSGTAMTMSPHRIAKELPETWVENIEDTFLTEYDSFHVQNNKVSINPKVLIVDQSLVGQYFSTFYNGGSEIMSVNEEDNSLMLDPKVHTGDILPGQGDNGVIIRPAGVEFRFIDLGANPSKLPTTGKEGDVCEFQGKMWLWRIDRYGEGEWIETNLFSTSEDFKSLYGEWVPQYRLFGATITELDDIVITTGTHINYLDGMKEVQQGASVPAFTLWAELQPRYL